MAQSGFTPIQLFRTTTAAAVPTAGSLADGELAINLTDEKLYFKNASGTVKLLASSGGAAGTVTSVDVSGGTTGLTFSGGPITSSGTITMSGTLGVANGGTGATSFTSGYLLKGNGTSAVNTSNVYDDGINVGIGTSTPNARLTVAGAITSYQAGVTDQIIFTPQTAGSGALLLAVNEANNAYRQMTIDGSPVVINTAGSEKMRVDASGNVGIGTTSPGAKLHVVGETSTLKLTNTDAASFAGMEFTDGTNIKGQIWVGNGSYASFGGAGSINYSANSGPHVWYTNYAERMRIDSSGSVTANVDIRAPIFYDSGNTAYYLDPTGSTSLNVAGNMLASGNLTLNNGANRRVRIGSATNYSYDLQTTGDDFQIIEAGTTPRLTIKYPNGYVGIGTTSPSLPLVVSNAGAGGLEFNHSGAIGNGTYIQSYNRSTAAYIPNTNYALSQTWYSGATRAMDLNSSGNLLINRTSYSGYGKLNVEGGADFTGGNVLLCRDTGNVAVGTTAQSDRLFVYANLSASSLYVRQDGAGAIQTWATFGTERATLSASGTLTVNTDIRAPIFYDSNNTNYYLDPASSSALNIVNLPSGSAAINTTTPGTTTYQLNFTGQSTADNAQAITWGWSTSGAQAGIYVQSSGSYGTKMYLATTDSFATGARTALAIDHVGVITTTRNYLQATGSLRAPIFYDSDDTSRYLDPSSTSVISNLIMANSGPVLTLRDTDSTGAAQIGYISFQDSGNAERAWFGYGSTGDTILYMRNSVGHNYLFADYTEASGSLRAPIFYDSNDTGRYVDPAGTSSLYTLLVNNGLGVYDSSNNDPYGKLSVTRSSGANYTYLGFTRSGQTAMGMGIDTSNAFWIGGTTAGYDGTRVSTWISITPSGNVTAPTDIRAPIFYDSSNTGYYLDPASTSLTYRMGAYYLQNNTDVSTDHPFGLYFDTGLSTAYAIFRESGAWTHPYPDLRIAFHTGIKMGANAGYGGMKFYTDYDMATQVMSINNSADGLGGGNVFVNSSLVAASSLRAPIFYDTDNTGYYVNPASTSYVSGEFQVQQSSINGIRLLSTNGTQSLWIRAGYDTDGSATPVVSATNIQFQSSGSSGGTFTFVTGNTKALTIAGDYAQGAGSLRAPIFYDSNDTNWYVDPSSSSLVNVVYGSAWYYRANGNYGFIDANVYADTVNSGYASDPLELCYVRGTGVNIGTGGGNLPIRADIFYEGTNTTYYVDPAATGASITVNGYMLGGFGALSTSGTLDWNDTSNVRSGSTGTLLLGTAANGPGPAIYFHPFNFEYSSKNGTGNVTQMAIAYGSPGNKLYMRGRYSGTWGSWVQFLDTGGDAQYKSGYLESGASLRAPIFYDSNNTGYYLDPAATGTSLNVAGSIVAAGNVTAYSDIRVKDNVETVPAALAKLSAIRGVTYTRTDLDDKERRYAGVIAQEIEQVLPEAIFGDEHTKTVDYNATIALLIQAVKELSAEVQLLKAKEY